MVRFSSAIEPSIDGNPLTAGMGLKFLRDGIDSANLVAMFSVDGTPGDWNIFSKNFTNHIPAAQGSNQKALSLKFAT